MTNPWPAAPVVKFTLTTLLCPLVRTKGVEGMILVTPLTAPARPAPTSQLEFEAQLTFLAMKRATPLLWADAMVLPLGVKVRVQLPPPLANEGRGSVGFESVPEQAAAERSRSDRPVRSCIESPLIRDVCSRPHVSGRVVEAHDRPDREG
jgi:hypothetical protein